MKNFIKLIFSISTISMSLISISMWFVLLYHILCNINASFLMWCIYWNYVPISIVTVLMGKIFELYLKQEGK